MASRVNRKGKAAFVAAFLGFVAWQGLTGFTNLEAGVEDELSHRLRAEYAMELFRGASPQDLAAAGIDSILADQNVTFESMRAVGTRDKMVVRVEIRVNGRPPADGRAVRYYRMSYRIPRGWRIRSETSAIRYYTAIF